MSDTETQHSEATAFDPSSIESFRFVGYGYDEATCTARLDYALIPRSGEPIEFTEEVVFTGAFTDGEKPDGEKTPPRELPTPEERAALDRCLQLLHWIAGVSYYKAALPAKIEIDGALPSPRAAEFLDRLYFLGLGELAYENQIDLTGRISFPRGPEAVQPAPLALPRCTAIPIGGGKDSVVTLEALCEAGEPLVLFSVGDYEPIRATSELCGLSRLLVERRIAPRLLELNRAGAINGHVPVSAVIAAILAVSAVIYGFDEAALSNEHSASAANLVWRGMEVNHQYSKSFDFEERFDELVTAEVLPGFRYYSFLRPLSELSITASFSRHEEYHPLFRSCNRAFHLDAAQRARHWCCDCPKCRFVFLALAPFRTPAQMVEIFGENMLQQPEQEAGFAALLGLTEHRPFECVGEEKESAAALGLLAQDPDWHAAFLVLRLRKRLRKELSISDEQLEDWLEEVMRAAFQHRIPLRLLEHLPLPPAPRAWRSDR